MGDAPTSEITTTVTVAQTEKGPETSTTPEEQDAQRPTRKEIRDGILLTCLFLLFLVGGINIAISTWRQRHFDVALGSGSIPTPIIRPRIVGHWHEKGSKYEWQFEKDGTFVSERALVNATGRYEHLGGDQIRILAWGNPTVYRVTFKDDGLILDADVTGEHVELFPSK